MKHGETLTRNVSPNRKGAHPPKLPDSNTPIPAPQISLHLVTNSEQNLESAGASNQIHCHSRLETANERKGYQARSWTAPAAQMHS